MATSRKDGRWWRRAALMAVPLVLAGCAPGQGSDGSFSDACGPVPAEYASTAYRVHHTMPRGQCRSSRAQSRDERGEAETARPSTALRTSGREFEGGGVNPISKYASMPLCPPAAYGEQPPLRRLPVVRYVGGPTRMELPRGRLQHASRRRSLSATRGASEPGQRPAAARRQGLAGGDPTAPRIWLLNRICAWNRPKVGAGHVSVRVEHSPAALRDMDRPMRKPRRRSPDQRTPRLPPLVHSAHRYCWTAKNIRKGLSPSFRLPTSQAIGLEPRGVSPRFPAATAG